MPHDEDGPIVLRDPSGNRGADCARTDEQNFRFAHETAMPRLRPRVRNTSKRLKDPDDANKPRSGAASIRKRDQIALLRLHLIERALPRRLVGAPAQQPSTVAE